MKYFQLAAVMSLLVAFSGSPNAQTTVTPSSAFPGQIVEVEWTGSAGTTVRLDGNPAAVHFETGPGAARSAFVQVPPHGPGSVSVAVPGSGKSFPDLEILPPVEWPAPRIEDISIRSFAIRPSVAGAPKIVDVTLAVSASNLFLDGEVRVNRTAVSSANIEFRSAIVSDRFDEPPDMSAIAYPVFHSTLLYVELNGWTLGEGVLTVEVRNAVPGGYKGSSPKRFDLPATVDELDSDGDGLLDQWETTDGVAFGCLPLHKDILVEVDWMVSAKPVLTVSDGPSGSWNLWDEIRETFSSAPVLNPDGSQGIQLYIDAGGVGGDGGEEIPDYGLIDFCPPVNDDQVNYYDVRSEYFSFDRLGTFHYCVFANAMPEGISGRAEVWGGDLIVAVQDIGEMYALTPYNGISPTELRFLQKWQIGTFIHELGHNLSLHHGGPEIAGADREELYKPNQPSVMNYLHQMCGVPTTESGSAEDILFTYSQGMGRMLDESNTAGVSPPVGARPCFNQNVGNAEGDLNYDSDAADKHYDYNEWGNLHLSIPLSDCMDCICYGVIQWDLSLITDDTTNEVVEFHLKSVTSGATFSSGTSCPPPRIGCGPGDSVDCDEYVAFVVVDCDTFYYTGDSDTVGVPGDTTGIETVRVTEGLVDTLHMVVNLQDTTSILKPPIIKPRKGPLLTVSSNGGILYGVHQSAGSISTLSGNTAILQTGSDTTRLTFRFPVTSPMDTLVLKQFNGIQGSLDMRSFGPPSKSDHVVSLITGADLAAGFIWLDSPQPIAYEPIPGLVLAQQAVDVVPTSNALKRVGVSIVDTSNMLQQGKIRDIQFQGVTYRVFVHTSAYRKSISASDDAKSGYLLRALILQK